MCAVQCALLLSSVEKAELQQCCYCCGSSKSWDSEWKQVKLVGVARRGVGGGEAQYRLPRLGSGGGDVDGYYCHRRHRPMTPPPRPACRRHKLSTIAILNDVRNMMGWVPLRSDYAPWRRRRQHGIALHRRCGGGCYDNTLAPPEGKCKLFPPTLVTPNHL